MRSGGTDAGDMANMTITGSMHSGANVNSDTISESQSETRKVGSKK